MRSAAPIFLALLALVGSLAHSVSGAAVLKHSVRPLHLSTRSADCSAYRYDAVPSSTPGEPPSYVKVCADTKPGAERSQSPVRQLSGSPFDVTFTCTGTTAEICLKAEEGIIEAGRHVAAALNITSPLVVNATFRSFCGTPAENSSGLSCELSDTLGYAAPFAILPVTLTTSGDQLWSIPQPLFKQFASGIGPNIQLAPIDIVADFNVDYKFWFKGDGPIQPNQADFVYTVTHELIHGLGFTARLGAFLGSEQVVTPVPDFVTEPGNTTVFQAWEPPAYFLKHVFTSAGDNAADLARTVGEFNPPKGTTEQDFVPLFRKSGAPYKAGQTLWQASVNSEGGTMIFQIPKEAPIANGTKVFLYVAPTFQTGSSLSHLAQEYAEQRTADFLMAPAIVFGQTLDEMVEAGGNWTFGPIGPRLMGMMSSMGWPTMLDNLVETPSGTDTVTTATTTVSQTATAATTTETHSATITGTSLTTATASANSVSTTSKPSDATRMVTSKVVLLIVTLFWGLLFR